MAERTSAARWAPSAGAAALLLAALLAGCASGPRRDGAPSSPPANLSQLPDAEPRVEPVRASGGTAKPYTVLGRRYVPLTDDRPFQERGLASWYGTGFHAQQTASGEPYDMYAMTAAHKTLPLPSYVWVRNPANGREAVVRVNDRGPFVDGRIIDLSYAAASRLGLLAGVAPVEIERITNQDIRAGTWRRDGAVQLASAAATPLADSPAPGAQAFMPDRAGSSRAVAVPAAMGVPVAASAAETSAGTGSPAAAPAAPPTRLPATPPAALPAAAPATSPAAPTAGSPAASTGSAPATSPPLTPPAPPPRQLDVSPLPPLAPLSPPAAGAAASGESAQASAAGTANAAPTPPAGDDGFWVQLGAFRARDGAVAMQERIERDTARPVGALQVHEEGGLFRLQSGPHASKAEAAQAQARWRLQLGGSPIVVQRR